MADSVARFLKVVRRSPSSGEGTASENDNIRMSGTTVNTVQSGGDHSDDPSGAPIGRTGNDWLYPDLPRGASVINQDPGDRLQDFANTHLGEGPNPGRIPRMWNNRTTGKLGRNIDGSPSGDTGFTLGVSGMPDVGQGDAKYIQHVQIPRGTSIARAYARTVDDSANVPGVYVSDPTRR